MKKKKQKEDFKYPLEDYSMEELYNMLRRPVQFKDFSRSRKRRIILIRIFIALSFISIPLLAFALWIDHTPISSIVAVTLSYTALVGNITHRDSAVIDSYNREEIKAEIEYRKYKESGTAKKAI